MIVTTSFRPSPRLVEEAERWAEQLGLRVVKRGNRTISALQRRYKVRDVLVVTEEGLRCYREATTYVHTVSDRAEARIRSTVLYRVHPHDFRYIYMNAPHPGTATSTGGWAISRGHWEGNTLVVDVVDFNGGTPGRSRR